MKVAGGSEASGGRPRVAVLGVVVALVALAGLSACRPLRPARPEASAAVVRGAVKYGAYCAGCHGAEGAGDGEVSYVLGLVPPDLGGPGVRGASDEALVARLRAGAPLPLDVRDNPFADARAVVALEGYLPALATADWSLLRAGRVLFEGECAACHGVYGDGDSLLAALPQVRPPDLRVARERHTDASLAIVSVKGIGRMPPMIGGFDAAEERALVAYVRHLSAGYRLYDTYCALCHGENGRGVDAEDRLAPAVAAPPIEAARLAALSPAGRRGKILHMLRRERGSMPHFRDLVSDEDLREIVAYLRTLPGGPRQE